MEGTIIGLLLGKIRGGKFRGLSEVSIHGWIILILALLLQLTPAISEDFPIFAKYRGYIYVMSMVLLILGISMNLKKKGMWAFLVGILLNLVVILFNDFQMPVSFESLKLAGLEPMIRAIERGEMAHYRSLEGITHWTKYLAKFIAIPKPYPLPKIVSIGDIFVTLGVILLIQGEMQKSKFTVRNRMITFGYKGKL
ncbi:DUF5317 domain-containing protein [Thermotalea metallivorans]|uniref:DUF5317 domain-containing protein n=1 Tax=Thermotalea metallivorans TaxID=520762 RepID=A0A140L4Q7_9FIRM|nr:DUF5317 domain-containing protein [Thermotalea metallivorans]KXG75532.1 hypothetical protein AN619_16740 [Thermotalea metallivorans]